VRGMIRDSEDRKSDGKLADQGWLEERSGLAWRENRDGKGRD